MRGTTRQRRVALFGNFGSTNLGNEASLQAMLYHLRRFRTESEIVCICPNPGQASRMHHVRAVPIAGTWIRSWTPRSPFAKRLRKLCIAVVSEPYSWLKGLVLLRGTEMLIVPGTGLLTDAYGLSWPYMLLKWILLATANRCRVLILCVGAGPYYRATGRRLVRLALSVADTRSYRDNSTKQYLSSVGLETDGDFVYPDLAFSLPEASLPQRQSQGRMTVGLGLIESPGSYGAGGTTGGTHLAYLEALVVFTAWLVRRRYSVRMLVADQADLETKEAFIRLLTERAPGVEEQVLDDPASSVDELLSQIATTDLVVATRFHGVLLSLLCGKPAISISFHHKCDALMSAMGMDEYRLDLKTLNSQELVETFEALGRSTAVLEPQIRDRASAFRAALDEQYERILAG
jgi:polysaccharide pyruvyl transferase WcaK-like protein